MLELFRAIFKSRTKVGESKSPKPTEPIDRQPIEKIPFEQNSADLRSTIMKMSFEEIRTQLQSLPEKMTSNHGIALVEKLYEIALLDHHVPSEHRDAALRFAETITATVEEALSSQPDRLDAFRRANKHTVEMAQSWGIGSLAWKLEEESVSAAEILPYVMRPEHRHLFPAFFGTLGKEKVEEFKKALVRHLILSRQYTAQNAVLILHGLAAKGDKAAVALFTGEEYAALLAVPKNYDAGRRVLVAIGLLPDTSSAKPFNHIPEIDGLVSLMLKERRDEADADNRLNDLTEEQKTALLLALDLLRLQLAHDNLRQIYGEDTCNSLMNLFAKEVARESIELFGKARDVLNAMPPGTPVDFMLLDTVMTMGGISPRSQEDLDSNQTFLDMGAEWLNRERVEFQALFRWMLRTMSDPQQKHGPRADKVEEAVNGEDWIGIET